MSRSTVTAADIRTASQHTWLLLKLRGRIAAQRGRRGRIVGGLILAWVFLSAASAGSVLSMLAQDGLRTDVSRQAVTVIIQVQAGELTAAAGAVLGFALLSAVANPFTGGSNNALLPDVDLQTVRPHRMQAWTDSLATTAFSLIGVVQLLSLTAIASLLSVDGGRLPALLAAWALWPAIIFGSSATGWSMEWVTRTLGPRSRRIAVISLVGTLSILAVFVRESRTLFGLSDVFAASLRNIAGGDFGAAGKHMLVVGAVTVALAWLGSRAASASLLLQPVADTQRSDGKALLRLPAANRPWTGLLSLILLTTLRTKEVRRPLVVVSLVSIPAGFIVGGNRQIVLLGILSVIPASVSLAWPVNSLGLLGPVMSWLGSQPGAIRRLPAVIWTSHILQIITIGMIAYLPGAIWTGSIGVGELARALAALVGSGALLASWSLRTSIRRPFLARLGGRGDTLVPPAAGLGYTVKLMALSQVGAGALGFAVLPLSAAALGVALLIAGVLLASALSDWSVREVPAAVTAVVAVV